MRKKEQKLFLPMFVAALILLCGCAAGQLPAVPDAPQTESSSINTSSQPENSVLQQTPEQDAPASGSQSTPQTLPEQEPTLTALEKAEARIAQEQAEYAARFTPENTFELAGFQMAVSQYGYLYVRRDAESLIDVYYGDTVYEEEGLTVERWQAQGHYTPKDRTGWVLVQKNGVYTDGFPFDNTQLMMDKWNEEYEEVPAGVKDSFKKWDAAAQTLTEFFNKTDLLLVTDLAKGEVRWQYEIQPESIQSVLKSSADGAWDICLAGSTGGGDAWVDIVVLRQNATGKLRQIGLYYDISSDYGFFRNGDLYVCEPENLLILTAESGYTEAAPFAMEFGNQPDGTKRILHALHRDPGGSGYVILYSQQTEAQAAAEWDSPMEEIIFYRMALCDTQGNLQQSWDSGYKRGKLMYDHAVVDMSRQGDTMFIRPRAGKGWVPPDFTFSLTDHTFAVLEEEAENG